MQLVKKDMTVEFISPNAIKVCDGIAVGKSVRTVCEEIGIGCETFFSEMRNSELLQEQYALARAARADARFESLDAVMDAMERGDIDPMTAKVKLDAIKWQCGKEKAKVYGDSTTIKGDKDNPLTIQALSSALDERVKARIEHKPDAE